MRYSDHEYGLLLYGDSDLPVEDQDIIEEQYVDLEKYVPAFISAMDTLHAWYVSQGYEVGREWLAKEILLWQLLAATVNTPQGCKLWEDELGMVASEDALVDQRRAEIIARLRSAQMCTPALLKSITETLTGVECQIVEVNAEYRFVIRFVGQYGVVKRTKVLKRMVEEIKPAHLAYTIEYRYVIWQELLPYTWDAISIYTWDGLRIMGIITRVTWHGLNAASISWRNASSRSWKTIKDIEEAKE